MEAKRRVTSILQAAQNLAYINLFKPKLLLLDEPDSHMHANNQAALCRLLLHLAKKRDFQVVIATHSRHVFSATQHEVPIRWVSKGAVVEGAHTEATAKLLELGALDALDLLGNSQLRCVVLTEDSDASMISSLLSSSDFKMDQTAVAPYSGCTKIDSILVLSHFLHNRAPSVRIVVHRDRDYLPTEDIDRYKKQATNAGCNPFITDFSDIECYFLSPIHINSLYSQVSLQRATEIVSHATDLTCDASIKAIINLRTERAMRERAQSGQNPNYGEIAASAASDYKANPQIMRRGKLVLAQVRLLLQQELGTHPRLETESPALLGVN